MFTRTGANIHEWAHTHFPSQTTHTNTCPYTPSPNTNTHTHTHTTHRDDSETFRPRLHEDNVKTIRKVWGYDRLRTKRYARVYTKTIQTCLPLVRRRSRASSVARQRLQNVIGHGLGNCAPQTHRDSAAVLCLSYRWMMVRPSSGGLWRRWSKNLRR